MTLEDIALTLTPGLGVKGVVHLLATFGDARAVFAASAEELRGAARLREEAVRNVVGHVGFQAAEREAEYCRRHGIGMLASTDAAYPVLLRETPDYPHVLYIKGDAAVLSRRCISMVATRSLTRYGEQMCNRLVAGLAERVPGLVIVSGLAAGGDAACHRAALANGVPTVGVLANPLPGVTPALNARMAQEMVERGGALLTELHSTTRQNGSLYPARNRIIAGLSAGTVVVESAVGGGTLITADYADGYGRTVLAVPGQATSKYSMGPNLLIRNRVAQLVLSAEDILRELMWDLELPGTVQPAPRECELLPEEERLMACFCADEPLSMDELCEASGLDAGQLAAMLTSLEISGAVGKLPGAKYKSLICN